MSCATFCGVSGATGGLRFSLSFKDGFDGEGEGTGFCANIDCLTVGNNSTISSGEDEREQDME